MWQTNTRLTHHLHIIDRAAELLKWQIYMLKIFTDHSLHDKKGNLNWQKTSSLSQATANQQICVSVELSSTVVAAKIHRKCVCVLTDEPVLTWETRESCVPSLRGEVRGRRSESLLWLQLTFRSSPQPCDHSLITHWWICVCACVSHPRFTTHTQKKKQQQNMSSAAQMPSQCWEMRACAWRPGLWF